jgi:hypothetical protein
MIHNTPFPLCFKSNALQQAKITEKAPLVNIAQQKQ